MVLTNSSSVARTLMENMGWKEGQGLGKEGQGRTSAVRPQKKVDNLGLGMGSTNNNWLAASSGYDAILAKLNIAYSNNDDKKASKKRKLEDDNEEGEGEGEGESDKELRRQAKRARKEQRRERRERRKEKKERKAREKDEGGKKSKKEKKSKKDKKDKKDKKKGGDEEVKAVESITGQSASARKLMYAKRLHSKRVTGYSDLQKAEIFGTGQRDCALAPTPLSSLVSSQAPLTPAAVLGLSNNSDEEAPEDAECVVGKITYEGGFTEQTQVSIYNQAVESQIKRRHGLGLKGMSRSVRKEAAQRDSQLLRQGSYLARKFAFGGLLGDIQPAQNVVA